MVVYVIRNWQRGALIPPFNEPALVQMVVFRYLIQHVIMELINFATTSFGCGDFRL